MASNMQKHWNDVYDSKNTAEVSWFQPYPTTSIKFLEGFKLSLDANIIDIGGGDSNFVDALLDKGYRNIWVLDISASAIAKAKKRLGEKASGVHWIVSDVISFEPPVQFDLWHDRAAFHFLTTEEKINKYVAIAKQSIRKGRYITLGTFSESGPQKCSGLEIKRYAESSISAKFQPGFNRIRCQTEDHITPSKTVQSFLFCSFQRN